MEADEKANSGKRGTELNGLYDDPGKKLVALVIVGIRDHSPVNIIRINPTELA
jgi:hypothetical protein